MRSIRRTRGTLVVGVGANGTALSGTGAWTQVAAGEGGYVAIDQTTPLNVYISNGPGVSLAFCGKGTACTSTDFAGVPTLGAAQVDNDVSVVDAPVLLDPGVQANVLLGTCRVWRGPADSGSGWSSGNALSLAFGGAGGGACTASNALVRSLAAGGPTNSSSVRGACGVDGAVCGDGGRVGMAGGPAAGHVFGTAAGATAGASTVWTDLAGVNVTNDTADAGAFNPGAFDVSSVTADAHDATGMTVYADGDGVCGERAQCAAPVPLGGWRGALAECVEQPAERAGECACGGSERREHGVCGHGYRGYVTTAVATCSSANCWSGYGASLPNAPVVALEASAGVATGDGRIGELRAGTYGRGIWQVPLLTAYTPAAPGMTVAPATLTFGAQAVGTESAAQTVTVTNSGNTPVTVSSVAVTGDFVTTNTCSAALAPGGTCAVSVRFLPAVVGARTGVLTVYANVPGGQATVALNGTALAAAAMVLNPVAASFATTDIGSSRARG